MSAFNYLLFWLAEPLVGQEDSWGQSEPWVEQVEYNLLKITQHIPYNISIKIKVIFELTKIPQFDLTTPEYTHTRARAHTQLS